MAQSHPYPPQPQHGAVAHYSAPPQPKKRNLLLLGAGLLLLLVALLPTGVFLYNLWQYSTVESRWASRGLSPEAVSFGVTIIQQAAVKRMMLFGPAAAFFGFIGLVLAVLGLRKR